MLKVETGYKLPKELDIKGSVSTLAQAVRVYEARSHYGLADTLGRGEVNRTTKKLYKQKGTGGARHGARSAPIFVGGGVTFGPKPKERKLKMSQALRKNALGVAVSTKAKEEKVVVVSGFGSLSSTKEMATLLKKIDPKSRKFVVAIAPANTEKIRFIRNIKGVEVLAFSSLYAYKVVIGGVLIIDKDAFEKEVKKETAKIEKKEVRKVVKKAQVKKIAKKGSK